MKEKVKSKNLLALAVMCRRHLFFFEKSKILSKIVNDFKRLDEC